ncbi:MAG TPA: ATP-binding protein [Galbitalea sp.]|jgi:signal transduction histidine kinase|nr:ATP-binding protein [Galbitalea sp.]
MTLQVAALILLALNLPTALGQLLLFPAWWMVAASVAVAGPALAVVIIGARARTYALQIICGVQAIVFLVVLLAVPAALLGQRLPTSAGMPWLVQLSMIAGAAAGVAWNFRGVISFNVALQTTVFALVFVSAGDPASGQALGDAVFGVFYVTLLAALAYALRRASVVLDRAVESAVIEARTAAAAEATRTARRRIASLIHDSVIVALLAYSNGTGTEPIADAEARSALEAIANLDSVESPQDCTPIDFAWELQALTTEHDPEAAFVYAIDGNRLIPAEVVEAIGEATVEALRNSIRHAAPSSPIARQVHVTVSDDLIEVVVLDDGQGFDISAVAPSRLGIRYGIIARLQNVGGSARVSSTAGYGTIVALKWMRR